MTVGEGMDCIVATEGAKSTPFCSCTDHKALSVVQKTFQAVNMDLLVASNTHQYHKDDINSCNQ